MEMQKKLKTELTRVKLIFNPISGANSESPIKLINIIKEMQNCNFLTEPYIIEKDCDLVSVIKNALEDGIKLIVACGGDGTVSSVARTLIGKDATLGIIPTGTQNNIAFSLGIPIDISEAVKLISTGKKSKIDVGLSRVEDKETYFIELCSIGIFSTLFSAGDDIQHGDLLKIGDFLTILSQIPCSEITLLLEDKKEITELGHLAIISNMPFVVSHYPVGNANSLSDGLLDVLFFSDLSKLDIFSYMMNNPGTDTNEDPRILHYRVKKITVKSDPPMDIMADGMNLGAGSISIEVVKAGLSVISGGPVPVNNAKTGKLIE